MEGRKRAVSITEARISLECVRQLTSFFSLSSPIRWKKRKHWIHDSSVFVWPNTRKKDSKTETTEEEFFFVFYSTGFSKKNWIFSTEQSAKSKIQ